MKKNNMYLYISIAIIFVFSIIYFTVASNMSYAFNYSDADSFYENRVSLIEKSGVTYAENNKNLFKDTDTIYVTVEDLITNKYLFSDEDGKLYEYNNDTKTFNDLKVKITYKDDKYEATLLTNG